MTPTLDAETCWQAVQQRRKDCDGQFFLGVVTTGVYCRPSCPSRPPKRENVRFYATTAEAERDGLRACLRCRPLALTGQDPLTERVERVCRYIEAHADEPLPLQLLAGQVNLSPFHLQRSFKAVTGLSPKQYVESCRLKKLKSDLRQGRSVTRALYDAGFGSSSRLYERADGRLGMTPRQYRAGGEGVRISYATAATPYGLLMLGATDRGLCFVQFGDNEPALLENLSREYAKAALEPMAQPAPLEFAAWLSALVAYLEGRPVKLDLPLDIRATAFQMRVWTYLQSIPRGQVQSYGEVAQALGQPKSARAVARACATNRVALVIPCHRVIRGSGELGGYRWGLARKRLLLDAERARP
jgi:AraC family transcriptional regulator of adaptative response/methylated-DNA-[protein]-cysteine methyltransferase